MGSSKSNAGEGGESEGGTHSEVDFVVFQVRVAEIDENRDCCVKRGKNERVAEGR